jgi:pyruvate,orthophosphate dikinase
MENIIFFNKDLEKIDDKVRLKLGIRGRRAVDLAMMGLPIAPGFIIDSELTKKLPQINLKEILKSYIGNLEKETKKKFGDNKKPLLLKVVLSSDLNTPYFPSIHNIGLNYETVEGFSKFTNPVFAYGEFLWLLRSVGKNLLDVDAKKQKEIDSMPGKKPKLPELQKAVDAYLREYGDSFQLDVYDQLSQILKLASSKYCESEIDVDDSLSIMVQAKCLRQFRR